MMERVAKTFVRESSQPTVVPGHRVVRSSEVAHVTAHPSLHDDTATIEVVTEGNVVRAIDVTCSCGKKMRLWCSYENEPAPRVATSQK